MFKKIINGHRKLIILLVLAIILVLIPVVVHSPYYIHLLIMTGINIALAMTFVLVLKTGLVTLAIAAFWAVGAYSSALLVMRLEWSFWLSLPTSALITGIIALCIGYLLIKTAGFGFVILSAVIGMLAPVIIGNVSALGGYQGIAHIPPPNPINISFLPSLEFVSKTPYYYLMLFLLLLVMLSFSGLYASWAGRAWTAIGLNPNLAESLGISVFKYRLLAFVVACTATGLMGSFYAHYIGTITPGAFGVFKTIYLHVYAILGGLDFAILGPVVGTFLMTFFPEFLRITKEIEPIFTGLLLILLILFLRGGILGSPGLRTAVLHPFQTVARIGIAIKSSLLFRYGRGKA